MKHEHTHSSEQHAHHGFQDVEAVAARLEAPERDLWQKPDEVIASFQLPSNATVAEIGAGTGYFTVRLARHLEHGTVIGLDTEPMMIAYLKQRAADMGLANLDARLVEPADAIPLTEPVDLLLCVDTYHHIPGRIAYLASFAKYLKPGGKLVIIDHDGNAPEGPPPELRLTRETVIEELSSAGFTHVDEKDFLLPRQFYLAFQLA